MKKIDKDKLFLLIADLYGVGFLGPQEWVEINRCIDASEVPTVVGRWLNENSRPKSMMYVCSECSGLAYFPFTGSREEKKKCRYAYCPRCGVKMEEME